MPDAQSHLADMSIDLNSCVAGQYLRTVHGTLLIYVGLRSSAPPYNHEIKFANGSGGGTRLDDGHVFAKNRRESDEDVVEILPVGWEQEHVTEEGIEVRVGQVWLALDKRVPGRRVQVMSFGNGTFAGKVRIKNHSLHGGASGVERWLSISRMHHHSAGFKLDPLKP